MAVTSRVILQPVGQVLIVPIQGLVDVALIDELRQRLLERLEQQQDLKGVIFDMSGVDILDADDFERLRSVINAAKLMGASVVMAGLQPGVAAGLMVLDVDTSGIKTALTVDHAVAVLS